MKRLKAGGAAAAVAVAALALSGCYVFSGLLVSKSSLKPGKTSVVTVKSYSGNGTNDRDVFFLMIALPNGGTAGDTSDDPLVANGGRFDTTGVLYNRPKRLQPSPELRDFFVNEGECGSFSFADLETDRIVVLATNGRVNQTAARRQVTSKYNLKQIRLNEQPIPNPLNIVTATGFWDDDGDGVPEPASGFDPAEASCTGGASHNINAKPPANTARPTEREVWRYYTD